MAAVIALVVLLGACTDLVSTAGPLPTSTNGVVPTAPESGAPATGEGTAEPPGPTGEPPAATEEPPASGPAGSPGPSASVPPMVDTFTIKRTASCLGGNGTGQIGMIKLTWSASGTTGVRISIDPPSPDVAYDYSYGDDAASGSAILPFTCDPPNHDGRGDYHLYVVWTLHDGNRPAYYRYAKVYDVTPEPSPTP